MSTLVGAKKDLCVSGHQETAAIVQLLSDRIAQALGEIIPRYSTCALVDFPNYTNVGDSAIWLGERACLEELGAKILYCCDRLTYSKSRLQKKIDSNSIILMQGGGNFGDSWHHHQRFREDVIRDFPNHRIVILPQSICFRAEETLEQARTVIDGHGAVTIMLRDWRSVEFARSHFATRIVLCPDMAFSLGSIGRPLPPSQDILWLARTDAESRR